MGWINKMRKGYDKYQDKRLAYMKRSEARKAKFDKIKMARLKREELIAKQMKKTNKSKNNGGKSKFMQIAGRIGDNAITMSGGNKKKGSYEFWK